jgi:hypothetical protein
MLAGGIVLTEMLQEHCLRYLKFYCLCFVSIEGSSAEGVEGSDRHRQISNDSCSRVHGGSHTGQHGGLHMNFTADSVLQTSGSCWHSSLRLAAVVEFQTGVTRCACHRLQPCKLRLHFL